MPYLPSINPQTGLGIAIRTFGMGAASLIGYRDAVMWGPSPLSIGERELIATYVSGLNNCNHCHIAHRAFAEVFGVSSEIFESLVDDPEKAGVAERLIPILEVVRDLTFNPTALATTDSAAAIGADWHPKALPDAIAVGAIFNGMNRIAEACGVENNPPNHEKTRTRIEKRIQAAPERAQVWRDYDTALMREPAPITVSDRELLAAYVSSLNMCAQSARHHGDTAIELGADADTVNSLLADNKTLSVRSSHHPLFAIADILTRTPDKIGKADIDAALEAGWSETAVFQSIAITGWTNHNNRLVGQRLGEAESDQASAALQ